MLALFPSNYHVQEIKTALFTLPEILYDRNNVIIARREYGLERIVSQAIRIAGSPPYMRDSDHELLIREINEHLKLFDTFAVERLLRTISNFIRNVVLVFTNQQWYDDEGSSPWRFYNWVSINSFDIHLIKPE